VLDWSPDRRFINYTVSYKVIVVEMSGIEPPTSALRRQRSSN
jgi:hypothetical protein